MLVFQLYAHGQHLTSLIAVSLLHYHRHAGDYAKRMLQFGAWESVLHWATVGDMLDIGVTPNQQDLKT